MFGIDLSNSRHGPPISNDPREIRECRQSESSPRESQTCCAVCGQKMITPWYLLGLVATYTLEGISLFYFFAKKIADAKNAVAAVQKPLAERNKLVEETRAIAAQRQRAIDEKDKLIVEKEKIIADRGKLIAEKDKIIAETKI